MSRLDYFYSFVAGNIYDKRDDFDSDIVNFPFLDGDIASPDVPLMGYTY